MKDYIVKWLKGILSAAIGGAATGVGSALIAPETFNFNTGLKKLGLMAGLGAIVAVCNYLKQSPLPYEIITKEVV